MSGSVPVLPLFQFSNSAGAPLANGTVTTYVAGSLTLTPTWRDEGLSILNTNPIELDSSGQALIYLDPAVAYKFLLKNAGGATVSGWPVDNIAGTQVAIPNYPPKFHPWGGQLRALQKSLTNPLEQITNITFMGDSITWGRLLDENASTTPRYGTLRDPRDTYDAPSFVNLFKAFIGEQYFDGDAPVHSNWSYSDGGQSTATFEKTVQLYPGLPPFSSVAITGSAALSESADANALLGYRFGMGVGNASAEAEFTFPFTGEEFTVVYSCVAGGAADYEVLVDGVSQGVFTSDTGVTGYGNRRTHTFTYVRDKVVTIKALYPAAGAGTDYFQLEAIEIPKRCVIVNQGVIGTNANRYAAYNFGTFGPTVLTADLNYAFIQLGTNDRGTHFGTYSETNGVLNFKANLKALIALITPTADVILMNANPADAEDGAFTMQGARDVINQVADELSLDVIDNYAIFRGADIDDITADGLHPNELGHALIARNIIGALEAA